MATTVLLRFGSPLTLSADGYVSTLRRCAERGVVGGAIYDALIAATAQEADACLVSRDHRAARTYEAIGVEYELIS
jgi:predicted nucleic acid-binding protein